MVDDKKKVEVLREIVGDDLADEILANAYHSEKEAIEQNMEFKAKKQSSEEEVIDEVMDDEEMPEGLSEEEKCAWLNKKKPKKEKEDSDMSPVLEEDEDEEPEMAEGEKETVILKRPKKPMEEEQQAPAQAQQPAPPKPADYERAESEPVAQRPAKAAIQVEQEDKAPDTPKAVPAQAEQVEKPAPAPAPAQKPQAQPAEGEGEYEEVEMEEVPLPEVIGNMTIDEFGELLASALSEALMPYLQTVKEARAELEKARLDFEVSTKEKDARESEVTALKEKVSTLSVALEKAAEKIAGLEGDVPAVAKPYIASQASDTILTEEDATLKSSRPREGDSFVDWLAQT